MAMEITNNYSAYENTYATQKQETAKKAESSGVKETSEAKTKITKKSNNEEYLKNLQKQVPYIKLQTGYGVNTKNDGKVNVVDVNPKLLEKMQNDPKAEKEYIQRLKDIEAATKWVDNFEKSMGYTAVCRHGYVDENGIFSSFAVVVRKDELNEKLRKEAQENAEKQIEKVREKNRATAEQLAEKIEKKSEKGEEDAAYNKAEQLLKDKFSDSKDGTIYLYDADMKEIMETIKEDHAGKTDSKAQMQVGANLDLQV